MRTSYTELRTRRLPLDYDQRRLPIVQFKMAWCASRKRLDKEGRMYDTDTSNLFFGLPHKGSINIMGDMLSIWNRR